MMFTSNSLINVYNRVYLHKPTLIRQLNSFSPGPIFILTKLSEKFCSGTEIHWNCSGLHPNIPCGFWEEKGKSISLLMIYGRLKNSIFLLTLGADILFHPFLLNGWTLKLGIYFIALFGWCPRLSSNKNRLNNGAVKCSKTLCKVWMNSVTWNVILPFPTFTTDLMLPKIAVFQPRSARTSYTASESSTLSWKCSWWDWLFSNYEGVGTWQQDCFIRG